VSALGNDDLGRQAAEQIAALDLDTTFLQTGVSFPTGTATVNLDPGASCSFTIHRPAAYDTMQFSDGDLRRLKEKHPSWLYFGTLFASTRTGRAVLNRVLDGLDQTVKFYDVNLRPSSDPPELVTELLERAHVVKLNEDELNRVKEFTGLPASMESFCREGSARYGWRAIAVTLGSRGCVLFADNLYIEEQGFPVDVADTVGAGDAFAAAFMHGLSSNWPLREIAKFANRVGALVASRHGAIPDWTLEDAVKL
jgi:fructokinase